MKLGSYTFEHSPDRWSPPRSRISNAVLETYSSVAYFSWGPKIIGQMISLEWDTMSCDQFNRIDAIYLADATVVWDPEIIKKIFHGAVTNGPFAITKTITGESSGATGTVTVIYPSESYIEFTPVSLVFTVGETFHDNSSPQKSSTITSFENIGTYNVQVNDFNGAYVENAGPNVAAFRKNVRLELLILSVV